MISLKYILKESIFDDDIDISSKVKDEIKKFIEDNYKCTKSFIISDKPNKNGLYELSSDGDVFLKNFNINFLTNDLFEWAEIKGYFSCAYCINLKTLKGAPKKINNSFFCNRCNNLKTLEGAPEYVGKNFNCDKCNSLKSLKGAPKYVGEIFNCNSCVNLKTLKGAPKIVDGGFYCIRCGSKFSKDDVKNISKVKYNIFC